MAMSSAASFSPATGSVSNLAGTDSTGTVGGFGAVLFAGPAGLIAARAAGGASNRAQIPTIPDKRREQDIGDQFANRPRLSPLSFRDSPVVSPPDNVPAHAAARRRLTIVRSRSSAVSSGQRWMSSKVNRRIHQ